MQQHGLGDLVVFPLQLLPDTASATEVRKCEQVWIQRFQSKQPRGYNTINAVYDADDNYDLWCSRVPFTWPSVERRIVRLYQANLQRRLTPDTFLSYFATFNTRTIIMLHTACTLRYDATGYGCTVFTLASAHSILSAPVSFLTQLTAWLTQVLNIRLNLRPQARAKRSILCYTYHHALLDVIDPTTAFRLDSVRRHLSTLPPLIQADVLPMVTAKYDSPLGVTWCNTPNVAKAHSATAITDLLQTTCVCDPSHQLFQYFRPFVRPDCGHVVTCDASLLLAVPHWPAPPGITDIFKQGPNYRPCKFAQTTVTPANFGGRFVQRRCTT